MEGFFDFLQAAFLQVLNMSLTTGIVILVVLGVRLLLRRAPKIISYVLWSVVLFRLLCPVSIAADISLLGLFDMPATETAVHVSRMEYIPTNIVSNTDSVTDSPVMSFPSADHDNGMDDTPIQVERQPQEMLQEAVQSERSLAERLTCYAAGIWLFGMWGMILYSAIACLKLKRKLVGVLRIRDNIFLSDYVSTPFVFGLFHPGIYLPSTLSEKEQNYIIVHEQHHIRRFDHWIKALSYLALCIHWFNPLVWLAFVMAEKDMEMSCDEAVVKKLGAGIRAEYSTLLLGLATGHRIISGSLLAFGEGDPEGRIKNLANWKNPAPWVILLSVLCCGILVACLMTNPNHLDGAWGIEETEQQEGEEIATEPPVDPQPAADDDVTGYDALIAEAAAVIADPAAVEYTEESNFSSVYYSGDQFQTSGYLIRDLDGNGVDELIFGENDEDGWNGIVFDIYTMSDGEVVRIIDGWERSRYYICENGYIAHEWDAGAGDFGFDYYAYQGMELKYIEGVAFSGDAFGEQWYYSNEHEFASQEDEAISEARAREIRDGYVYEYPQFIPFVPGKNRNEVILELLLTNGMELTLNVWGKQGDGDSGLYGVREINVWGPDGLLQTIQMQEAIEADGVDGIETGYTECTSAEESVSLRDVNFDGYLDIEVCGWLPNNSIPYYYWCWNPDSRRFEYAFCLPLTEVDLENRQLIAWYKVENGLYYKDYYTVTEGNQLELKDREIEDDRPL